MLVVVKMLTTVAILEKERPPIRMAWFSVWDCALCSVSVNKKNSLQHKALAVSILHSPILRIPCKLAPSPVLIMAGNSDFLDAAIGSRVCDAVVGHVEVAHGETFLIGLLMLVYILTGCFAHVNWNF